MKKYSAVLMILMFAGLFLTSCEKELLNIPGNTSTNDGGLLTRDGEGEEGGGEGSEGDSNSGEDGEDGIDEGGGDSEEGITDGGRDEDFDKSSRKKPKPN